jgi:hypothetical protein
MSENKTNFIIAVRGYKNVTKQKNANFTDVTALDNLNNKVLLRMIEPLTNEYIGLNDVKNVTELIKHDNYNSAILISRKFTDSALEEMSKQKIQHVSEDYMPPFDIEELYSAIMDRASNQCQKKCGKALTVISDCDEHAAYICKIKLLAVNAKNHFEDGTVGLLKNDLKVALALNR